MKYLTILLLLLQGCTVATMTLSDGTSIKYIDVHLAGSAVQANGIWEGVGAFQIDKDKQSPDIVEGIVKSGLLK